MAFHAGEKGLVEVLLVVVDFAVVNYVEGQTLGLLNRSVRINLDEGLVVLALFAFNRGPILKILRNHSFIATHFLGKRKTVVDIWLAYQDITQVASLASVRNVVVGFFAKLHSRLKTLIS